MPTLIKNTSWETEQSQTVQNKIYTMSTSGKYVDRDIAIGVNVPGMNLEATQTFYVNDGIYTWTWTIDADGNVTIT